MRKTIKTDSCWLWNGGKQHWRHGVIKDYRPDGTIKTAKAHRVAWTHHFGQIPEGMWVLHKCDVGNCVNPEHLFLGTPNDNVQDMIRKGRSRFNDGRRNHKLTAEQVEEIRSSTLTQRELAAIYGVTRGAISHIKTGRTWSKYEERGISPPHHNCAS